MNDIRKDIKKLMIDHDVTNIDLLPRLSERLGRQISRPILSMAVSGYRTGKSYQEIVEASHAILIAWPEKTEAA